MEANKLSAKLQW